MNRRPGGIGALALGIALALGLGGCGGGGGTNVRPTPPVTPPADNNPPPTDEQPTVDSSLILTDAKVAHAAGFTGAGVTIGFVDTGLNRTHPALTGRVVKSYVYLDASENNLAKDDVVGHGTWVAQVAAGAAFANFPGGIAPGASLVSSRIISDTPPVDDGSGNGNQVEASDADFFAQYLHPDLIAAGVNVMNNSWGGLYFDPDKVADVAEAFADSYRPFVIDNDGIVVFATGNEGKANPTDTTSLPFWAPDLERGWIAAAALDTLHPDQLADYSNACGRAMDYCLAAPGDVVVTGADDTAANPGYWVVSGTSFAAPQVSGAAAVVWQAFPYFDNDMVRQTLLGTAKDLGAAGVDPVFGWGLLDVGKAVKGPANFAWGDVSVAFDDITSTWSNDIVGAGGLVKDGSGTLVLAGDNHYEGETRVSGGIVQAAFPLPASAAVEAAGMLDGVPGVAGNLDNAGIVAVHGGDTEITGDFMQTASGQLWVNLGSVLAVDGSATLAGTLKVTGKDEGYTTTGHQNVLTTAGSITGTFDSLAFADGVFLSSSLQYDTTAVWLDTTSLSITATAQSTGMHPTAASMGAAQRVETAFDQLDANLASGGTGGVSGDFLRSAGAFQRAPTLAAAQRSLESLSGQLHAASAAMTFAAIDASTRVLSDRFDDLLDDRRTGAGMWMRNLSASGAMARSGFDGVGYRLDGWLAGSDNRVGQNGVAGFAFGQDRGVQQLDGRADRNRSRGTEGMLYAGWIGDAWYTQGRVGFGRYDQHVDRQLLLGSSYQGVSTDYAGRYDVAYGESGMRIGRGASRLTPFVDMQYARIRRDGFAEQGAGGFGLQADAQDIGRWQAGVGVRAAHHMEWSGGRALDFTARVEWQRTLASRGDVFDASFVGLQQWQPLAGIGLSRYSGLFGLGLDATLSPDTALAFGYDYQRGDRAESSSVSARLTVAF